MTGSPEAGTKQHNPRLAADLTPGSPLAEGFLEEWDHVESLLVNPDAAESRSYGHWFFAPQRNALVRFAPAKWHRLALVVRNSILLESRDHAEWTEVRRRLEAATVAVAGCSVGSSILHTAVMLMRPRNIKVADLKAYQLNNGNRVRLSFAELGQNKAEVCANQLLEADPFLRVAVYGTGIDAENVGRFVGGSDREPAATIVVEETDDPDTKLLLREEARRRKTALIMVTDVGPAAQVDVRRFDLDPHQSLTVGVPDDEIYALREACEEDPTDRRRWVAFAEGMSGKRGMDLAPTFRKVLHNQIPLTFSGVPQLASAATIAGGMAAWTIAQIVLGHQVPERRFFEPGDGLLFTDGVAA